MIKNVGVVCIQGDFEKHLDHVRRIGMIGLEVRDPEDLEGIERLIIPGGESTTVGILMQRFGLGAVIIEKANQGLPIWGTCMGMIIMAKKILNREQYSLGLLDITVERNAFGAQVHSFETLVPVKGLSKPVSAAFIRAPIVTEFCEGVEILSEIDGKIVAVKQGRMIGTSFHPELTDDTSFLEFFCQL